MKRAAAAAGIATTIGLSAWLIVEPFFSDPSTTDLGSDLTSWLGVVALIAGLGLLGGLVAWHRPDEPMGWLFLAFALTFGARSALESYAIAAFAPPATAAVRWAVFGSNVLIAISTALLVTLAVVFPSGRAASRRWRRALLVVWAVTGCIVLTAPFAEYAVDEEVAIPSLITIRGGDATAFLLGLPLLVVLVAAVVRIVRLGIRGTRTERLQVRWLAYTLVVTAVLLAIAAIYPPAAAIAGLISALGITASIAVAITRYRLYEIDQVISRTVSYAVVLGTLAVVFVAIASVPTFVLDRAATPSWVIATSTLVVFSLFNPLRRRVQRSVDRRFHRLPYDPDLLLELLGRELRDEIQPDAVAAALVSASSNALQPSTAQVWVRR